MPEGSRQGLDVPFESHATPAAHVTASAHATAASGSLPSALTRRELRAQREAASLGERRALPLLAQHPGLLSQRPVTDIAVSSADERGALVAPSQTVKSTRTVHILEHSCTARRRAELQVARSRIVSRRVGRVGRILRSRHRAALHRRISLGATFAFLTCFMLVNLSPNYYADAATITSVPTAASSMQSIAVAAQDTPQHADLGGFTATGPKTTAATAALSKLQYMTDDPSLQEVESKVGLPVTSAVTSLQDDYPYRGKLGGGSPLGYVYGNCTDFAAWRVNRDAGVTSGPWKFTTSNLTPHGGNGGQWANPSNLPGWSTTTSPVAGDLVSFPMSGLMSTSTVYGHVAYVAITFSDGSVVTENYGGGKYFVAYLNAQNVRSWVASGGIVFRHNNG